MFCFVGLKCQKCCDLRAFLGVKSGLTILVRVKDFASLCGEGDASRALLSCRNLQEASKVWPSFPLSFKSPTPWKTSWTGFQYAVSYEVVKVELKMISDLRFVNSS